MVCGLFRLITEYLRYILNQWTNPYKLQNYTLTFPVLGVFRRKSYDCYEAEKLCMLKSEHVKNKNKNIFL